MPLMSADRKPCFALIGCGAWGRNYARVLHELPGLSFAAACDLDPELLAAAKNKYPYIRTVGSLAELLQDTSIVACVIATPASTHYAVASEIIRSGRHVLVEKPLTLDSADGDRLVSLAAEKSCIAMVGHTFVFNSSLHKMHDLLSNTDEFGEIYYLHSTRTNLGPIRKDTSAIWDLAAHDVSIFSFLLDGLQPEYVSATGHSIIPTKSPNIDLAFITLFYPGGKRGHIHVSWCEPCKIRKVVAVGSKQHITFDDMNGPEPIRVANSSVSVVEDENLDDFAQYLNFRNGDISIPKVGRTEPLMSQVHHFLQCIAEKKNSDVSPASAGVDVVRVLEAAERSIAKHGTQEKVV